MYRISQPEECPRTQTATRGGDHAQSVRVSCLDHQVPEIIIKISYCVGYLNQLQIDS